MNATERRQQILFISALLETIAEAGEQGAPSGTCYAAFMAHGVSFEAYQSMVSGLVGAGLITNRSHLLRVTPKAVALIGSAK